MNALRTFPLLALIVSVAACGGGPQPKPQDQPVETQQKTADKKAEGARPTEEGDAGHTVGYENFNATLWVQTSVEYAANTRGVYAAAKARLDDALEDDAWTAAVEQTEGYSKKPPAIILDVDETVLDNSAYQARLIQNEASFHPETWNAWCEEGKAGAVPGALEFTKYAAEKGVAVFYVTNRDHSVEEATRTNLEKLGFPLKEKHDVILTKKEKPDWGSDKTPRREEVANDFRIVMLFGDNLGDFIADAKGTPSERASAVEAYEDRWGKMWFMLPNPMYGYWEGGLYDYEYGEPYEEKVRRKSEALKP